MTLNLRLLPCEEWSTATGRLWGYSHTILELGPVDTDAWNAYEATVQPQALKLPAVHDVAAYVGTIVPDGRHKGERIYGTIRREDVYGTAYEAVEARHLLPWLEKHFRYEGIRHHEARGPYQTAIVAYVRALPPDAKIVLDWH